MMTSLRAAIFVMAIVSIQAEARSVCGHSALKIRESHKLAGAGYWMQSAGKCKVTYATWGGSYSRLYNICTDSGEPINNQVDAFPVPGDKEDLYVQPVNGISFFKFSDGARPTPIFRDMRLNGDYQSVGLLPSSTDSKRVVRISMGSASGIFRDYSITKEGAEFKIEPAGEVTSACTNLPSTGLTKELPILSRDGQMIAGREIRGRHTKVFKIANNGECTEVAEAPGQTGKVNFSYDNKHIAYIIDDPRTGFGRLMEMDLETKKTKTLSAPIEDVNYMTYRTDGTLMYSRRLETGLVHHEENSDLVIFDPKEVPDAAEAMETRAIGFLWAANCRQSVDADFANAIGSRLNKEDCQGLVDGGDMSALEAPYASIPKEKLKSICGAGTAMTKNSSDANK